jgi:hypothetical protein
LRWVLVVGYVASLLAFGWLDRRQVLKLIKQGDLKVFILEE